jgi:hypothetical protein
LVEYNEEEGKKKAPARQTGHPAAAGRSAQNTSRERVDLKTFMTIRDEEKVEAAAYADHACSVLIFSLQQQQQRRRWLQPKDAFTVI